MTIDVQTVMEHFDDLIGSIDYACYKDNRDKFPHWTPKQWEWVFKEKTKQLESLYQAERQMKGGEKR